MTGEKEEERISKKVYLNTGPIGFATICRRIINTERPFISSVTMSSPILCSFFIVVYFHSDSL